MGVRLPRDAEALMSYALFWNLLSCGSPFGLAEQRVSGVNSDVEIGVGKDNREAGIRTHEKPGGYRNVDLNCSGTLA